MTEVTKDVASPARHREVTWQDPLVGAARAQQSAQNGHGS